MTTYICKECKGEMIKLRNWSSKKIIETICYTCTRCRRSVEETEKLPDGCEWK